jgi:hypothetical protein
MIKFETKSTFSAATLKAQLAKNTQKAQMVLDAAVLSDSNYFVPLQTGKLQQSGITNTRIGSGEVVWRTPYARAQYYGENFDHTKQRNPNACAKWFEAAKARFNDKWVRLVNERIGSF